MDGRQPALMMQWWRKDEAVEEEGRTPERRGIVGVCSGFADRAQNRAVTPPHGARYRFRENAIPLREERRWILG